MTIEYSNANPNDGYGFPYDLRKDGKWIFTGSANECFMKLQRVQSQSADWAMKHEGYTVAPSEPQCIICGTHECTIPEHKK